MQTTSKINKAGVSLIAVLLFMLIATIAATATWKWISSEGRSSASRMLKREAYQSSIAGIENTRAWMTFHGNDVSLERHRPNRERYPVGRPQEPNIKIEIGHFIKTIEEKIKNTPELMRRLREGNKEDSSNQALANAAGAGANSQQPEERII